jgi:hypothetical protein
MSSMETYLYLKQTFFPGEDSKWVICGIHVEKETKGLTDQKRIRFVLR